MNYWQFKFNSEKWLEWEDITLESPVTWKAKKTVNKEPNDIYIGDIVFIYRGLKKKGIYFLAKVTNVDFEEMYPVTLEIIKDLRKDIFIPENFGFADVVQKINKLNQNGSYYKFTQEDRPEKIFNQLVEYYQDGNLAEDIKLIESDINSSSTEKESLIKARIGQGDFRKKLILHWNGCSVTNHKLTEILIASHIKPWRNSTNEERLDVYNGLLLLPNIDKLFDKGYISFDVKGKIILSKTISDYDSLGIDKTMKIKLDKKHNKYLEFHRKSIFKK